MITLEQRFKINVALLHIVGYLEEHNFTKDETQELLDMMNSAKETSYDEYIAKKEMKNENSNI